VILVYTIDRGASYILLDLRYAYEIVVTEDKITVIFERGVPQVVYLPEKIGKGEKERLVEFIAYRKNDMGAWKVEDLIEYVKKYVKNLEGGEK